MFYTRYSKVTARFLAWTLCRNDVLKDWKSCSLYDALRTVLFPMTALGSEYNVLFCYKTIFDTYVENTDIFEHFNTFQKNRISYLFRARARVFWNLHDEHNRNTNWIALTSCVLKMQRKNEDTIVFWFFHTPKKKFLFKNHSKSGRQTQFFQKMTKIFYFLVDFFNKFYYSNLKWKSVQKKQDDWSRR